MPPVKPGNGVTISGLKYKGISYIIEFVSDKVGRAYFMVDGAKGSYAGKFTLSPVQLLPEISESNVRANNAPKPPVTKAVVEPPVTKTLVKPASPKALVTPKAAVAPPVTKAVPTPVTKAAPKPSAVPKAAVPAPFFERQQGLGCGRHALNNLFGERLFVKGTQNNPFTFPPPPPPYSLQGLCAEVSKRLRLHGIPDACLVSENYDVNTITAALDYLGYSSEQTSPSAPISEEGDFVGLLLNLGVVQGTLKHWVALRFKRRAPDGTVTYTLYDSLYAGPSETTLASYLKRFPNVYTIKVLPKGAPTNPIDRIDSLPFLKGSTNAAAAQTSWIQRVGNQGFPVWENPVTGEISLTPPNTKEACTEFFDPCTKESLGSDPAVLETRILEILSKKGGTRRVRRRGKRLTRKL